MADFWGDQWLRKSDREKLLYLERLRDLPWVCVRAALAQIKSEQTRNFCAQIREIYDAASAFYRSFLERKGGSFQRTPEDEDWERLVFMAAEIEDVDGNLWRFEKSGLLRRDPATNAGTIILRAHMKPLEVKRAIARAKLKYGYPFANVVHASVPTEQIQEFQQKLRQITKVFAREAAEARMNRRTAIAQREEPNVEPAKQPEPAAAAKPAPSEDPTLPGDPGWLGDGEVPF